MLFTRRVALGRDEGFRRFVGRGFHVDRATWEGKVDSFPLTIYDTANKPIGTLEVKNATFQFDIEDKDGAIREIKNGVLDGFFSAQSLVGTITSVGGIDFEGASNLVKQIYNIPIMDELPEDLPAKFTFTYTLAE